MFFVVSKPSLRIGRFGQGMPSAVVSVDGQIRKNKASLVLVGGPTWHSGVCSQLRLFRSLKATLTTRPLGHLA